jgi:NAD(P)-dependent dehydrogenase (short-subunit alcohol dehydrogenase family)
MSESVARLNAAGPTEIGRSEAWRNPQTNSSGTSTILRVSAQVAWPTTWAPSRGRSRCRLLGEKQPSLEFATPEQLGALATFLCSDAAAQLNGAALPVDGGWLAR